MTEITVIMPQEINLGHFLTGLTVRTVGPAEEGKVIPLVPHDYHKAPFFLPSLNIKDSMDSKNMLHQISYVQISDPLALNCNYFLTHQFKHVFGVLKRTVSLRRFF